MGAEPPPNSKISVYNPPPGQIPDQAPNIVCTLKEVYHIFKEVHLILSKRCAPYIIQKRCTLYYPKGVHLKFSKRGASLIAPRTEWCTSIPSIYFATEPPFLENWSTVFKLCDMINGAPFSPPSFFLFHRKVHSFKQSYVYVVPYRSNCNPLFFNSALHSVILLVALKGY